MKISFKDRRLQEECNNFKLLVKHHGIVLAKKLRRRLDDLDALSTLEELGRLYPRCHELSGNRRGQLSIDLEGQWRLLFIPADEPPLRKPDGGIDWKNVRSIEIIGIEDTHE